MKTMKRPAWLCLAAMLVAVNVAHAQVPSPATEKLYLNVNFGGQLASRTLGTTVSKTVYDESATLTSTEDIKRAPLVDVSLGYRVWGDFYVGLNVWRASSSGDAAYTASVPDPAVFNRPKTSRGTASDLSRTELAFNPNVSWVTAVTDKLDLSVGVGLAVIKLKQELAGDFSVPPRTQDVVVIVTEQEGTAKGVYAALDLIYSIKPKIGVGGFVRYAGGSVDLDAVQDHNVGGMQAGGGIRLRF
jgi:hypothetical protein